MNPEYGQSVEEKDSTVESIEKKMAKGAISIAAFAGAIEILMM